MTITVLRNTDDQLLTVQDSLIHGKGVFAVRDLFLGEILLRMPPDAFSTALRNPWNASNRDVIGFYLNHSCEPNAALSFSLADQQMRLVALRQIRCGIEITLDYFCIDIGGELVPCHCNTRSCRGRFPIRRQPTL